MIVSELKKLCGIRENGKRAVNVKRCKWLRNSTKTSFVLSTDVMPGQFNESIQVYSTETMSRQMNESIEVLSTEVMSVQVDESVEILSTNIISG
jgi:hypothetical protein